MNNYLGVAPPNLFGGGFRKPTTIAVVCCCSIIAASAFAQSAVVEVEETVYTLTPPDNGSGPLWSYGCTPIGRVGDDVYLIQMETGEDVPRLCNTRWKLLRRAADGWEVYAEADQYRQREPGILAVTGGDTLNVYLNDSLRPPGEEYKACFPHILRFTVPSDEPRLGFAFPQWAGDTTFTDHSYRGYAADGDAEQLLMLNINAATSDQHYALLDEFGVTQANGTITFPIRACYPQVALVNGAAHVMAIGDIVEPVGEWREYKSEQTGRAWDYVFRRLFYTWSPDLQAQGFAEPIEIANVDDTAGHISNQDMWIAPDGRAYCLYTQQETQSALMRDKFFPDASLTPSLRLAVIQEGEVVERHVLIGNEGPRTAGHARFHETPDGHVYALLYVGGENSGNKLMRIYPELDTANLIDVPFEAPFGSFLLANTRSGNAPANVIDVFGVRSGQDGYSYGRIRIE